MHGEGSQSTSFLVSLTTSLTRCLCPYNGPEPEPWTPVCCSDGHGPCVDNHGGKQAVVNVRHRSSSRSICMTPLRGSHTVCGVLPACFQTALRDTETSHASCGRGTSPPSEARVRVCETGRWAAQSQREVVRSGGLSARARPGPSDHRSAPHTPPLRNGPKASHSGRQWRDSVVRPGTAGSSVDDLMKWVTSRVWIVTECRNLVA